MSIFEYNEHFSYLRDRFKKTKSRGIKGQFAEKTQMQPAYLSQVLAKKYSLSLEQADLANSFFEHTIEESEFFLLLVGRDRSGTASLKKHFSKQIDQFRKKRLEVIERLGRKCQVSDGAQEIYYSSWLYSAVHVALTVSDLRRLIPLKNHLGINREKLLQVLQFLESQNLIYKKNDEYFSNQNWVRLESGSPQITKLHTNWRMKAIQSLDNERESDLHFSGVYSLDPKTATLIRESLLENISKQLNRIEGAPEKELYVMNFDFFNLKSASE